MPTTTHAPPDDHDPHAPRTIALIVEPFALWLRERRDPDLARAPLVACRAERVTHANATARRHGVLPGMRLAGARLRAPALTLADDDEAALAEAWQGVMVALADTTPWLEARRRGRAILRASERDAHALAARWRARVGVGDDVESAELAALTARPGEVRCIPPGGTAAFLARLPLRFLRGVGLGEGAQTRLRWLGLTHAGDLAAWRAGQLRAYLGAEGTALIPYLHGPRRTLLRGWQPPLVLRASAAFEQPLFEPAEVEPAVDALARSLAFALRGRVAQRVGVHVAGGAGTVALARLAKRPLRHASDIRAHALFALRESDAARSGIAALALTLTEPRRAAEATPLWDRRGARDTAVRAVEDRYPDALRQVVWGDAHASAADVAWAWGRGGTAVDDAAHGEAARGGARRGAAARGGTARGGRAPATTDAPPALPSERGAAHRSHDAAWAPAHADAAHADAPAPALGRAA